MIVCLGYSWSAILPYSIPFLTKMPKFVCSDDNWESNYECDQKYFCPF